MAIPNNGIGPRLLKLAALCGVFDGGDNLHLAAAMFADRNVDIENLYQALRPGHRGQVFPNRNVRSGHIAALKL